MTLAMKELDIGIVGHTYERLDRPGSFHSEWNREE